MKKILKKSLLAMGMLALFMFVLAACSSDNGDTSKEPEKENGGNEGNEEEKGNESDATPTAGGKITVGFPEEPNSLDMHKTGMVVAYAIGTNFGGTLLTVDPETLEVLPNLAEDYDVSEDGKTITLQIKSGVTFHDGSPLTAQSFKDTFERAMNPDTGSVLSGSLLVAVKEIRVPDELTLEIELNEPSAPFLLNLASGYLQVISTEAIEVHGEDYGKNPVGVGPYQFKNWETGQSILLTKYEDFNWPESFYENKGSAYPDELEFKFIKDYQTKLAALDSGSIDIAMNVEAKDVARYRDNDKFEVKELERQGIGSFIEMNIENDKLKDPNLRKALNMAINKEVIIQAVIDGEGSVANGPLSPNIFGYDPEVENYGYKYNQDEAVGLLESAGWSKNANGVMEKDGEELRLELLTTEADNQKAQIIQAMLKEIGIEINIQSMEQATLIEKAGEGDFELSFLSYSYNDPDVLYMLFHSSQIGGLNHTRVNNADLDALLEQGRTEMDLEKRKEIYIQAQKIIVDEAYWTPLYTDKVFHVINKRVHNVKNSPSALLYHDSWVTQ